MKKSERFQSENTVKVGVVVLIMSRDWATLT